MTIPSPQQLQRMVDLLYGKPSPPKKPPQHARFLDEDGELIEVQIDEIPDPPKELEQEKPE